MLECPRSVHPRSQLLYHLQKPPTWLEQLPRCTLKTGWVTYDADVSPRTRVDIQIQIATLGLEIMRDGATGPQKQLLITIGDAELVLPMPRD